MAKTMQRASLLAQMLPVRSRRRCHRIETTAKLYMAANATTANMRYQLNWEIIPQYYPISEFLKNVRLPTETGEIPEWTRSQLDSLDDRARYGAKNVVWKIPQGRKLPPVYLASISTSAELNASQWYMNHIPRSEALSKLKEDLVTILEKRSLNENETSMLEENLYQLVAAQRS